MNVRWHHDKYDVKLLEKKHQMYDYIPRVCKISESRIEAENYTYVHKRIVITLAHTVLV